jgi:transporter family protein
MHVVLVPILISTCNFSNLKKDYWGIFFAISSAMCSAIAAYFYARAVKGSDVSSVLSITTCYPALAFILSVIFLGESFSLNKFFGFAIMVLGAIIVNR